METINVPCRHDREDVTVAVPTVKRAKGLAVTPLITAERADAYVKGGTVLPLPTRRKGEPPLQWAVTHEASGFVVKHYDSKSAAVAVLRRLVATGVNWTLPAEEILRRKAKFLECLFELTTLERALLAAVRLAPQGIPAGHLYAACGMGADGAPDLDTFTTALRRLSWAGLVRDENDLISLA